MEESDFSIQKEVESLKGSAQEDSSGYQEPKESPFNQFFVGNTPASSANSSSNVSNDLQFWINQANTNAQLAYQQSLINQQLTNSLINALVKKSEQKSEQTLQGFPWKFLSVVLAICSLILYILFKMTQKSNRLQRRNPKYPIQDTVQINN